MRYYAVRYKSAPKQIRIEKADTPQKAFRLAFGGFPICPANAEYKDLGSRVAVIQSDKKRIALLTDPNHWVTFPERQ